MKKIAKKIFPPQTYRRKIATKMLNLLGMQYLSINPVNNFLVEKGSEIQRTLPAGLTQNYAPLISIVVPVYNVKRKYFEALLNSVLNQSYANFELIIVDGGDDKKSINFLKRAKEYDDRIVYCSTANKGISGNTNTGIKKASGEFIALLDHDDLLHPDALLYVISLLNTDQTYDLIYTDEGKVTEDGEQYMAPHYKPDFSPALLRNLNYITHFSVIRKTALEEVGLLDSSKDGAQDYDLFLKIMDHTKKIAHIPKLLYHWREAVGSTSVVFQNKPAVGRAGALALTDHFARNNMEVRASIRKDTPGFYEVEYEAPKKRVCLLINSHGVPFIDNYIGQLKESTKSKHSIEIVVISELNEVAQSDNTVRLNEELIRKLMADSDIVIAMNDLVMPKDDDWLDTLVSYLHFPSTYAVCPTTIDYSGKVLDKGFMLTPEGDYPLFRGFSKTSKTSFGDVDWDRNVNRLSLSVACFQSKGLPHVAVGDTIESLIDKVSDACGTKEGYIVSVGRCYVELIYTASSYAVTESPSFFNQNLSTFGDSDYLALYNGQLPVTDKSNVVSTLS